MPSPAYSDIRLVIEHDIARLTLCRADRRNAFDGAMIDQLIAACHELAQADAVRLVWLQAEGPTFCAGADLNWMRKLGELGPDANLADARRLADMLWGLSSLPMPVVATVQGDCMGGGVGLVAACDVVIAAETAGFSLSEVKLGLIPATIGPHVLRAIGARQAQRLFVTAERIKADEAQAIGLIHRHCPLADLVDTSLDVIDAMLLNGPQAMRAAKQLVRELRERPLDADTREWTAQRIATLRASDEGREGMRAFQQRRPPAWCPSDGTDTLH